VQTSNRISVCAGLWTYCSAACRQTALACCLKAVHADL
jgi:hypothetical protein